MSKTSTKSNDSSIGVYDSGPSTVQSSNTSSNNSSMSISSSNKSMDNSSISSRKNSPNKSPMRQNLMESSFKISTPTSNSKIKKSVSKSKSNKSAKVENSPSTRKKQSALKKIKKAYRKSDKSLLKKRLRTYYLKGICSDSGVCIAFDKEMDKIVKYFDHFTNFSLIKTNEIVIIGDKSVNGSVWLLPYEKNEYKSEAIMKIPGKSKTTHENDNVVFEYINGNFMNQLNNYFPCLVLTYGLFLNTSKKSKLVFPASLNQYKVVNINTITDENLIRASCENPTNFSVLLQYFKDSVTMDYYLKNKNGGYDFQELIKCLFQIYYFLHFNREIFTHNDLHTNNVLMYEPVKGKHIHYTYTLECGETIEFTSRFMPKIIDYGRSYTSDSEKTYTLLCNNCNNCGIYNGYSFFENNHPNNLPQHMSSLYPNVSQDLRLYFSVQQEIKNKHELKPCVFKKQFGTPPITENERYEKHIGNVTDCYHELINELKKIKNRSSTDSTNCIAAIEVKYDDVMKIKYNQKNAKNPSPKK
jgi:hypothetical protein